jgi:hypothetical protein
MRREGKFFLPAFSEERMRETKRREFLKSGIVSAAAITSLGLAESGKALANPVGSATAEAAGRPPSFHLGLVTYNLARDWE